MRSLINKREIGIVNSWEVGAFIIAYFGAAIWIAFTMISI